MDATEAGTYTLKVGYLGTVIEVSAEQTLWAEITFPLTDLNENFTFTGEIFDPSGDSVSFVKFTTSNHYAL